MTAERYQQINALAGAALETPPDRRRAFLDQACGSDSELRQHVEELLAAEEAAGALVRPSVLEVLVQDLAIKSPRKDLTGRRIQQYEVISRLGAGGIGEVWLARDTTLTRDVALKLLSPAFATDPLQVWRFEQEARAASQLNHPNIVTIYEIRKSEDGEFIAQEFVHGETLRQRLQNGPLPLSAALDIGMQVAAALAAAHNAGIVHRDIKPENIMIRPDGVVKVLDFGLARFIEGSSPFTGVPLGASLTRPGFVLGTVAYMSPEQARGRPVDQRTDIFSLGVLLYEISTGAVPFSGPTPADIMAAILKDRPPGLRERSPDIPAEFERIVHRCLEKKSDARYSSADEIRLELNHLSRSLELERKVSDHASAGSLSQGVRPANERSRPVIAYVLAIILLIAAAVGLATILRRRAMEPAVNSMQITPIPARGDLIDAAIAPDGKSIAYFAREGNGQSLWIAQPGGSQPIRMSPPRPGVNLDLTYSSDGRYLYYLRRTTTNLSDLYRVSTVSGLPVKVMSGITGSVAIAPNGEQLAFVRVDPSLWQASIVVVNTDGNNEHVIATRSRPEFFQDGLAWSPDGRSIACFSGKATRLADMLFHLSEVRIADGAQRTITPHTWSWPASVVWSADGHTLVVDGVEEGGSDESTQLWLVSHSNGRAVRLTNDLSNYPRVTATSDGKTLLAVAKEELTDIWVGPDPAHGTQVTPPGLHARVRGVAWTPEGRIVFVGPSGRLRRLWIMDADGSNAAQLTSGPENLDEVVVTRDGRYILYQQNGNIWRINSNGRDPKQLTHGALDVHPDVSADGKFVVYASFSGWSPSIGGKPALWKVSIDGGQPIELSSDAESLPHVSPDGKFIASFYYPDQDPRWSRNQIAVLHSNGGRPLTMFDPPQSSNVGDLSWAENGKALDYVAVISGIANIWRQPLPAGEPYPVTKFRSGGIFSFAWSRDFKQIAVVHTTTTTQLVLINGFSSLK